MQGRVKEPVELSRAAHQCVGQLGFALSAFGFCLTSGNENEILLAKTWVPSKQNTTGLWHRWFFFFQITNTFITRFSLSLVGWNAGRWSRPELFSLQAWSWLNPPPSSSECSGMPALHKGSRQPSRCFLVPGFSQTPIQCSANFFFFFTKGARIYNLIQSGE